MAEQPQNFIIFGPEANCTLALCDIEWSLYQYRPSLAANTLFMVLYGLALGIHVYLGIRWRKNWWFALFMMLGCVSEMIGYGGRIMMWQNPWSFPGFLLQVCFISSGPVYFTAAIYVTLSKTIENLSPTLSRVKPKLFYWFFIPADLICLIVQAAGGVLSTLSQGSDGVTIAQVGLALQVVVMGAFIILFADYLWRYYHSKQTPPLEKRMQIFLCGLSTAIILILGRCIYRSYELSQGYRNSELLTDEGLFIALEGVLIVVAVLALCVGHPGFVFHEKEMTTRLDSEIGFVEIQPNKMTSRREGLLEN